MRGIELALDRITFVGAAINILVLLTEFLNSLIPNCCSGEPYTEELLYISHKHSECEFCVS
jgi:hypothetical protein